MIRQPGTSTGAYSDQSYDNDRLIGARIEALYSSEAIRAIFPPEVPTVTFEGTTGYLNRDGGWAAAAQGIEILLKKVKSSGVEILAGKAVLDFVKDADGVRTCGVRCADGSVYPADLVVVASGSWTPSSFPKLDLHGKCLATGCVSPRPLYRCPLIDVLSQTNGRHDPITTRRGRSIPRMSSSPGFQ